MFQIWYIDVANSRISFFLRLIKIPLYVYTTFSLSIRLSMDIWVVSIILAVVNNAAVNLGV